MTQDTQSDGYTYVVSIYGADAVNMARAIRKQIVNEFAQAERELASAIGETHEVISSQTRRLSYNMARLEEVSDAAKQLGDAWLRTLQLITTASPGTFDSFVSEARQAYEETAGHSYFGDILRGFLRMILGIEGASEGAFDKLVQEAQQASQQVVQQIEGVTDKAGKLRFPAGAMLEGVSIQGREATPEKIEKYNQGLLQLNDVMTGIPLASAAAQETLKAQGYVVADTTGFWEQFTDQLNMATLQYFGVRRLGYGLEQFGSQLARAGKRNIEVMMDWTQSYVTFNQTATLAAAAMEMTREEQGMLEDTVLSNIEAMRLFDPSETVDGLRIWAAGTGQVVHTQDQLNEMLEQTHDIQLLAALGNENLGDSMEYVGAAIAEYGLGLQDTDRVSRVFNFTAAKTFAQIGDMGNAFKLVGPEAAAFGISLEETASVLGLLSDRNIKGTMAGRAFRQMLIQLAKPTKQHTELLNEALGLNEELGESWQDLVFPEGQFIGIARYIDLIAAATEHMTEQQRNALLATMATANELPALTSLIDAQTQARKDGINVIQAWTKWMVGAADEEVAAFADMMSRTRNVEVDTATNMYNLWAEQAQLYYDSEAAKAQELERRWEAMQTSLGKIVLDEGAPVLEAMIEQLEKIVKFAADNPGLVTGLMTAAAAELILGNLITVTGQIAGVIANFLILKGSFAQFGGAVGAFQSAVAQFTGKVAAGKTTDTVSDATYGAGTLGIAAILKRLAGVAGIILAVDQPTATQRQFEDMLEVLRKQVQLTEDQWNWLQSEGGMVTVAGTGTDYGRAVGYEAAGRRLSVQDILEMLEEADQLTDKQQEFLDEIRSHPVLDIDVEGEIPPEIQTILDAAEGQTPWEIAVQLQVGTDLTEDELEIIGLFDDMQQDLLELENEFYRDRQAQKEKFLQQLIEDDEQYFQDVDDATQDHLQDEEDAYRKHMQKLAEIRARTHAQMEEELIRLGERIDEVWIRASERIADIEDDTNDQIEDAREEHLKTLRRLEEDHRDRLVDLSISRDAYGIWQEMRDYKKRVDRENEDYESRIQSLRANGANRIEEIRRQAAREEAELRRSYDRRIAELERQLERQLDEQKRQYAREKKERDRQFAAELKELDEKYRRQRDKRIAAYRDEKQDLINKFNEEYTEIQRATLREIALLRGFYDDALYDQYLYLQDRLDQIYWYMEQERELWENYNPYPTNVPQPTDVDPSDSPTGVVPSALPDPLTTPTTAPTLNVTGDVTIGVEVTGDLPEQAADELAVNIQTLFENALRNMEVRYV